MASIELTEDMGASNGPHKMADLAPMRKTGLLARRTLGLACLLLTVCLWTTSNFLASVSCAEPAVATPAGDPLLRRLMDGAVHFLRP